MANSPRGLYGGGGDQRVACDIGLLFLKLGDSEASTLVLSGYFFASTEAA
jgi:hypothetical protein